MVLGSSWVACLGRLKVDNGKGPGHGAFNQQGPCQRRGQLCNSSLSCFDSAYGYRSYHHNGIHKNTPKLSQRNNQSKRKTSYANGQTNLGHKHKAPDHNHESHTTDGGKQHLPNTTTIHTSCIYVFMLI